MCKIGTNEWFNGSSKVLAVPWSDVDITGGFSYLTIIEVPHTVLWAAALDLNNG